MENDKRKDIAARIQKLLAKAESTTFGPERDALLGKVEELMVAYAISDWELAQAKPGQASKPERISFPVAEAGSPIWYELSELAMTCCEFFNCKSVYSGLSLKGKAAITAQAVGYPEDLRNAEFLFQSLKLQLLGQLEPKYDHSLSLLENIERMKMGGVKWERQHEIFKAAGAMPDVPWSRSIGINFTKIYSDYCREHGKDQIKANPRSYQVNFAQGFKAEISRRVAEIKDARRQSSRVEETADGTSVALVLVSRERSVDQAYKEYFPRVGRGVSRAANKTDSYARGRGQNAARSANLGSGGVGGGTRGAIGG